MSRDTPPTGQVMMVVAIALTLAVVGVVVAAPSACGGGIHYCAVGGGL